MKNIFLCLLLTATCTFKNAKAQSYAKGKSIVTGGYGFPDFNNAAFLQQNGIPTHSQYYYSIIRYETKANGFGPVFLKYDHALNSLVSIGAVIAGSNLICSQKYYYTSWVNSQGGSSQTMAYETDLDIRYSSYSAGARLNLHFSTSEKVDPYAGIAIGYTLETINRNYTTSDPTTSNMQDGVTQKGNLYFGVTAGMRYYLSKDVGIYGEIGLDKWSLIQLGIAVKFPKEINIH